MSSSRKIPNAQPYFPKEDLPGILDTFEQILNGRLTLGPYVEEFEQKFAQYTGTDYAVALHSATNALEIALRYFNVRGKEVIVPTETFIATPNAVLLASGEPVFADIDSQTLNLSIESIRKRMTSKTRGVIIVHMLGLITPEIYQIKEFCEDNNLFFIEDAAHAHGAKIDGRKAGTLSDAGCFSFYATKVLTSAEGGMITTDNPELANFARSFRHHGMDSTKENCVQMGSNYRMDEFRAVLGLNQLRHLDDFLQRRRNIAQIYTDRIVSLKNVNTLPNYENIENSYWKFPVILSDVLDKNAIVNRLKELGVEVSTPYTPLCHLHPFYREKYGYKEGDFPIAEEIVKRYFCLPMYCALSDDDVYYVLSSLENALKGR